MAQNVIQRYPAEVDFHNAILKVLEVWYNSDFRLLKLDNHLGTAAASDYPTSPLSELATLRTLLSALLASSDYVAFKENVENFIRI